MTKTFAERTAKSVKKRDTLIYFPYFIACTLYKFNHFYRNSILLAAELICMDLTHNIYFHIVTDSAKAFLLHPVSSYADMRLLIECIIGTQSKLVNYFLVSFDTDFLFGLSRTMITRYKGAESILTVRYLAFPSEIR